MKTIVRLSLAAILVVLVCTLSACPNPEETFTIHVVNSTDDIEVTSLTLAEVSQLSAADVTGNLLRRRIREGGERTIIVSLSDVGDANGISMLLDGAQSQRNSRVVDGGFAAGITINVTLTGNRRLLGIAIETETKAEEVEEE